VNAAHTAHGRPVSLATIRRLAITKQCLAGPRLAPDLAGMKETIRRIRCMQLDPTSTVARSHVLVLWSRLGSFDTSLVDRLAYRERWLFEYWAHAASLVLSEDYPMFRLAMRSWIGTGITADRVRTWMADNESLRTTILGRLRREGPLGSRAFADLAATSWTSTGWTNERNVERMLSFLWGQGKVGVANRVGGQRMWDLARRCLPRGASRRALPPARGSRLGVELSVRALGAGRPAHIRDHFAARLFGDVPAAIAALERSGRLARLHPTDEGMRPGPWFVHVEDVPLLESIEAGGWEPRTTLLSPFDNLIRDRARTNELFDFDYRLEIYTPKAKRRYGFYVLPVLDGDRLVGRLDPAFDRDAGRLDVRACHVEAGTARRPAERAARAAVNELAAFLGAGRVVWPRPGR